MTKAMTVRGAAGEIAVYLDGPRDAPVVLMSHSILTTSAMWDEQAALLAGRGLRVIRADTRGHGDSSAPRAPYAVDDLVADTLSVLDALDIERVHLVGLSLGGMMGFGLGIQHPARVASLVLCAARADMPPAAAAPWDERTQTALREGCAALAAPTMDRWFGQAFLESHPELAQRFRSVIGGTSVEGFVGCARAIQRLDYLPRVPVIACPTTFIVGANDGPLPQAMAQLHELVAGSVLEVIAESGHLPNIDQPAAFGAALLRHCDRVIH